MNFILHHVRQVPRKSAILCITALKESWRRSDYIIAMDEMNIRNIMRIIRSDPENKVSLLLSHAGIDGSIADPWYTGNFDDTYSDVLLGCKGLFREVTGE